MSRQRQKPSVWSAVRESWRRTTTCDKYPAWCDGSHPVLYHSAGEPADRDHYREIGRVNDGGPSVIVVGIALHGDPGDPRPVTPSVHVLHLSDDGEGTPEMCCGEVYLTAAEARAIAPLLVRAAEVVEGATA